MKAIIYTKSTCPYCHKAKDLLNARGIEYTQIDYPTLSDSEKAELLEKTNGHKTVPQIFLDGRFVGGFSELDALDKANQL